METQFKVGDKIQIPTTKSRGNHKISSFNSQIKNYKYDYLIIRQIYSNDDIEIVGYNNYYICSNIFGKEDLKHYKENKMEKTAVLSLHNAKQMYKSGIESIKQFALNNYSKEELESTDLPKSWKELEKINGCYISGNSEITKCILNICTGNSSKNVFPTESLAKASLALSQLLQLRDKYNEGLDLRLGDIKQHKYSILFDHESKDFEIILNYRMNNVFTFISNNTALLFLDNFKDLLWEAKELI